MRGHTGRTWFDLAEELDLLICDGKSSRCRKHWSPWMHSQGRVDQMGVVHWDGWNRYAVRRGLYRLLKWAALAKNRPFRNEPLWLSIYHQSTWAAIEGRRLLHRQITYRESIRDRERVKRLARNEMSFLELRDRYPNVYAWIWYRPRALRGTMRTGGARKA